MANGDLKGAIKPIVIGFAATAAVMFFSHEADAGGKARAVECAAGTAASCQGRSSAGIRLDSVAAPA